MNAQGFEENKIASQEGGKIAGDARKALEKKSGVAVSTKLNNLSKNKSYHEL